MFNTIINFHQNLILPTLKKEDKAHQQYILNVLLVGCWYLTFTATLLTTFSLIYFHFSHQTFHGVSPLFLLIILTILTATYLINKTKPRLASYIFLLSLWLPTAYTSYHWGALISQAVLTFALIVIFTGILISARTAFIITGLTSFYLVLITHLQFNQIIPYNSAWRLRPTDIGNALTASITLIIISLVAWLATNEMNKALYRAKKSERALLKQKQSLEKTVYLRTKALREIQAQKMIEWHRLVELGKSALSVFHDIKNPLTNASLNIEQINMLSKFNDEKNIKQKLNNAFHSLKQIGDYINTQHQKTITNHTPVRLFSPASNIRLIIKQLQPLAHKKQLMIKATILSKITIRGNKTQFQRVVANLITNAIDAYQDIDHQSSPSSIKVGLVNTATELLFTVKDHGKGIAPAIRPYIFAPLYSTKSPQTNFGLGLSIVKDIVEKSFNGKINFISSVLSGKTVFTVKIPLKK